MIAKQHRNQTALNTILLNSQAKSIAPEDRYCGRPANQATLLDGDTGAAVFSSTLARFGEEGPSSHESGTRRYRYK